MRLHASYQRQQKLLHYRNAITEDCNYYEVCQYELLAVGNTEFLHAPITGTHAYAVRMQTYLLGTGCLWSTCWALCMSQ
jgi:hypothetical protein